MRYESSAYESALSRCQLLVLDDECDEGSVAAPGEDRTIPISIAGIWQSIRVLHREWLMSGYTATAAASLLQDPENELFPSHFVQILRYPAPEDGPLTYGLPGCRFLVHGR